MTTINEARLGSTMLAVPANNLAEEIIPIENINRGWCESDVGIIGPLWPGSFHCKSQSCQGEPGKVTGKREQLSGCPGMIPAIFWTITEKGDSQSSENNNIPASQRSMPANQRSMPAGQRCMPASQRYMPANQRSMPASQRSMPANQRCMPAGQRRMPASQRCMPANQRSMPVSQRSMPASQRRMPASQRSMPAS